MYNVFSIYNKNLKSVHSGVLLRGQLKVLSVIMKILNRILGVLFQVLILCQTHSRPLCPWGIRAHLPCVVSESLALKNLLTRCLSLLMSPTTHEYFNRAQWYLHYAYELLRLKCAWCFSGNGFIHDRVSVSFGLSHHSWLPDTVPLSSTIQGALRPVFAYWCAREHLLWPMFPPWSNQKWKGMRKKAEFAPTETVRALHIIAAYCCLHAHGLLRTPSQKYNAVGLQVYFGFTKHTSAKMVRQIAERNRNAIII